jgi:excinuclease ABC subunit A
MSRKPPKRRTDRVTFSEKFACPVSGFTIPEIEPRLFSFNNPHGACPNCDGLGVKLYDRSGSGRARSDIKRSGRRHRALGGKFRLLPAGRWKPLAKHYTIPTTPWNKLPERTSGHHPASAPAMTNPVRL